MKKAEKPLIGRPPIAEEARRSVLVRVLVTEAEREQLQRGADAAKMSVSNWMRILALREAEKGSTKADSG